MTHIQTQTEKPYFIITAGPTASGKGSLKNKIISYLNATDIITDSNTTELSIDEYIEKNPYFIQEIDKYFKLHFKSKKEIDIQNEFNYPSPKTIIFFNKLYWKARRETNCETGRFINLKKKEHGSCGELFANKLNENLKNKKNIIFETQGITFPFWIFKKYPNDLIQYNIIITWSVVDICELYKRNKSRAYSKYRLFIENFQEVPRMPDIRHKNYKRNLINIIETFKKLLEYYGPRALSKIRLLIFDNRTKTNINMFDSFKNSYEKGIKAISAYDIHKKCELSDTTFKISPKKSTSPRPRSKSNSPTSPRPRSKSNSPISPRPRSKSKSPISSRPRSKSKSPISSRPRSKSKSPTSSRPRSKSKSPTSSPTIFDELGQSSRPETETELSVRRSLRNKNKPAVNYKV
jgi:hypothetical protein